MITTTRSTSTRQKAASQRGVDSGDYYTVSNFRHRLYEATKIMTTGEEDVKNRLMLASTEHLIFANIPPDSEIPDYFQRKLQLILDKLSQKQWNATLEGDRIRATLHLMRRKTASKIAEEIWLLFNEYEEYQKSGFIPGA